jgi:hypothetical protein
LGRLQHRGDLRVRGCEETGDLLGQGLVGRQARQLALPKVEITARQPIELGAVILFRGHEWHYSASTRGRLFRNRGAACRTAVSALRFYMGG